MSAGVFPIERKKMYLFFAVVEVFVSFVRFAMLPKETLSFHLVGYVLSAIGFCLLWESILFAGKKLENKFPIESHPYTRFFLQTLITYVIIIFPSFFYRPDVTEMVRIIGYLFYFLVAAVLNLIYFGVTYFFNWKNDLVALANMRREQTVVKYDALRNQLNPHFLFNALTSLNSLIFDNQQLASDFLQQLSKVYRYVLQNKEKETVSLSTELDFIYNYTFLLKTRFSSGIEFNINLSEEAKEKEIVPVTLQILIENAVKHNIISSADPLKISITEHDSHLILENNINKKTQVETSNKQGLENLKSLYHYLIDKPIQIIETNNIFTVKIPLI
jgi:two-component system, LytTR family, sensor kinase